LSLSVTIVALFVPTALVIFLERPALFSELGFGNIVLLRLGLSFPIVLICFSLWYAPLAAIVKLQRLMNGWRDRGREPSRKVLERRELRALIPEGLPVEKVGRYVLHPTVESVRWIVARSWRDRWRS
jgi:hypothetical protein